MESETTATPEISAAIQQALADGLRVQVATTREHDHGNVSVSVEVVISLNDEEICRGEDTFIF